MTGFCRDCFWWHPDSPIVRDFPSGEASKTRGVCGLTVVEGRNPMQESSLALPETEYGDGYSVLVTKAEYGCVQFHALKD